MVGKSVVTMGYLDREDTRRYLKSDTRASVLSKRSERTEPDNHCADAYKSVYEICFAMVKSVIDLCVSTYATTSRGALTPRAFSCMGSALPRSSHPRESPRKLVLLFPNSLFVYNTRVLPLESNIPFLHFYDVLPSDVLSSSRHN